MRLLHSADLHLGFRTFDRLTADGQNIREADVMRTFRLFVDRAIAMAPELIVIGGDIMHSVRPSNGTIIEAHAEFSRLMQALPSTVVVAVAGNHDLPRTRETASILQLFAPLGIHVIDHEAKRLSFPALGLSVLGVPDSPFMTRPSFDPDPAAKYNVLVLHGEVEGMMSRKISYGAERAAIEIQQDEIQTARWDYCALGHYHVFRELAPNLFYSGSLDYTSTNPWGELDEQAERGVAGKGFVEHDLATGVHTFHPLLPSRAFVDLEPFSAHELSAEDVDAAIATLVAACPGGIEDKVVRMVITDLSREVQKELDAKAIRSYKARALNFHLVTHRPAAVRQFGSAIATGTRRPSLEELFGAFMAERFAGDPRADRLIALGQSLLADAASSDDATIALPADSIDVDVADNNSYTIQSTGAACAAGGF